MKINSYKKLNQKYKFNYALMRLLGNDVSKAEMYAKEKTKIEMQKIIELKTEFLIQKITKK